MAEFEADESLKIADRKAGKARVGGKRRCSNPPRYVRSYLEASRIVVDSALKQDRLPQLAMPCVYLLRHALELTLKDLLDEVYRLHDMTGENVLEASSARVVKEHDLSVLHGQLESALNVLHVKPPKDLSRLVQEIHGFEDGDPTRSRYRVGVPKRKYKNASFPDETVIPILDWQQKLERVWEHHLSVRVDAILAPRAPAPLTLAESLARKGQRKFEASHGLGIWSRYANDQPR